MSSLKSNSFSVNFRSILGSRMPHCGHSMIFSATILVAGSSPTFRCRAAGRYERSGHILDRFSIKSLTSKEWVIGMTYS
jgi:hypothetical protein